MQSRTIRAALLAVLLAGTATATTLKRFSLEQVADASREIVVATARRTTVVRGGEPRNLIFTEVEFGTLDVWKGSVSGSTVTYRFAGGKIGERTLLVPGVPKFDVGKRYALFVDPDGDALCPTIGWVQGCYQVRKDEKTSVEYVYDADGHAVYGFTDGAPVLKRTKRLKRPLTLVEFQVEVIRALEAAELHARERAEKAAQRADGDPAEEPDEERGSDTPPAREDEERGR